MLAITFYVILVKKTPYLTTGLV